MRTEKFVKVAYRYFLCCRTVTHDVTVMKLDPVFHSGLESTGNLQACYTCWSICYGCQFILHKFICINSTWKFFLEKEISDFLLRKIRIRCFNIIKTSVLGHFCRTPLGEAIRADLVMFSGQFSLLLLLRELLSKSPWRPFFVPMWLSEICSNPDVLLRTSRCEPLL